jgi:hypothetical protein
MDDTNNAAANPPNKTAASLGFFIEYQLNKGCVRFATFSTGPISYALQQSKAAIWRHSLQTTPSPADSSRRLNSWKEIARHMGREVRTVMRWEKERNLPIHRGPGGKIGLVFAETGELEAWLRGHETAADTTTPAAMPIGAVAQAVPRRWSAAIVAILALALGVGGWRSLGSQDADSSGSAVMTDRAVIARRADGSEKWRYALAGELNPPPFSRALTPTESLGEEGILAATSYVTPRGSAAARSGQLLWLDASGALKESFSFEDRLRIGTRDYSAPWVVSDFQINGGHGRRLIAVAAHHFEWWPSIVTILDSRWRRQGSFVSAGWIEYLRWLPDNRLAIAGFSNVRDGAMVALLDVNAMNGQSPSPRGGEFDCAACGSDRPLRYIVMPRSEVNRANASPFNRASVSLQTSALLVRTMEVPGSTTTAAADALYEFTAQLDLIRASYSDRYWEMHREMERLGKITHTRENCPDRDGPRQVDIWEPATGWRVQAITAARRSAR